MYPPLGAVLHAWLPVEALEEMKCVSGTEVVEGLRMTGVHDPRAYRHGYIGAWGVAGRTERESGALGGGRRTKRVCLALALSRHVFAARSRTSDGEAVARFSMGKRLNTTVS